MLTPLQGEALYRFLLSHASTPPDFILSIKGTHQERRTRTVSRVQNGRTVTRQETYTVTITDFSFFVDLTHHILPEAEAPIWVVGDSDPAYRGSVVRQVDNTPLPAGAKNKDVEAGNTMTGKGMGRRKATPDEKLAASQRREAKYDAGLPPWVLITGEPRGAEAHLESEEGRRRLQYATNGHGLFYDDSVLNPPTKTIRDWADEYCASKKKLKEFTFRKQVYGWNLNSLRDSIDKVVRANWRYSNTPSIAFVASGTEISVQPDNGLSRTLSKTWAYVLLWIFLVYPLIIWPFKRFSRYGGGEWRVSGSAFAFTKWVHMEDSSPGETVEDFRERHDVGNLAGANRLPTLKATPRGVSQLVGMREGEWYEQWQETIGFMVRRGHVSGTPERMPMSPEATNLAQAGAGLDGYRAT